MHQSAKGGGLQFNTTEPAWAIKRSFPKRYIDVQIQKGGEVNFTTFKHFQFGVLL
jgi:hypothetical protein